MTWDPLDPSVVAAFLEPRHLELAHRASAFARDDLRGSAGPSSDEEARRETRALVRRLGEADLLRWAFPSEAGGVPSGPDFRALCLLREVVASASPLADSALALQALGTMPVLLGGSEEQVREWVPPVASGQEIAAFAMTEPEAGSDVAAMSTRAIETGGGWQLDGRKHLITNAGVADRYLVFASTDPDAGARGITCFLVRPDDPGFVFVGPQVLSEPHPLGEIAFEGCRLPDTRRVGPRGGGFRLGMATLDRLRATVGAAACGMAARALEEAFGWTRSRRQFGRPLADLPLVQQKLARSATDLAASRLLVYRAAAAADSGQERVTLEAAMAKLHATEAAQRIVDDAVQVHGGRGVLEKSVVDRLYRSVRALRIYEGASEVQYLVIARQIARMTDEEDRR